jgi:hypothetical protein
MLCCSTVSASSLQQVGVAVAAMTRLQLRKLTNILAYCAMLQGAAAPDSHVHPATNTGEAATCNEPAGTPAGATPWLFEWHHPVCTRATEPACTAA